jgi:hypothetical protein
VGHGQTKQIGGIHEPGGGEALDCVKENNCLPLLHRYAKPQDVTPNDLWPGH